MVIYAVTDLDGRYLRLFTTRKKAANWIEKKKKEHPYGFYVDVEIVEVY